MEKPEAIVYLNGNFVRDRDALVSIHDQSFTFGYGVFDTTRTYNGKLDATRLELHLDRFFQSMKVLRLTSPISRQDWIHAAYEVVKRNQHMVEPLGGDFWVFLRLTPGSGMPISRGVDEVPSQMTYIVEVVRIPFKERAPYYVNGLQMVSVSTRRIPSQCIPPRVKLHSYVNNFLAEAEAKSVNPSAYALMQDTNGNIAEGSSYNFFLVKNGKLLTPREQNSLAGVSRATIIRLAEQLGITVVESDMDLYDAYNADEAFLTSTSMCLCPIGTVNGQKLGHVWGPVTCQLRDAYKQDIGVDFVKQYTRHCKSAL